MKNAQLVSTPLSGHMTLSKKTCPTTREEKESVDEVLYSSIVRSVRYPMICTKPDIAHVAIVVSMFLENP